MYTPQETPTSLNRVFNKGLHASLLKQKALESDHDPIICTTYIENNFSGDLNKDIALLSFCILNKKTMTFG